MKNLRQSKILELIDRYEIETQEELSKRLEDEGIYAAQATLSRDIKSLNLVKVTGSHGQYKYASHVSGAIKPSRYQNGISHALVRTDYALNTVVLHTIPGMANPVAAFIDGVGMSDVLGSIAGDDTVFVITRSEKSAETFGDRLKKLIDNL